MSISVRLIGGPADGYAFQADGYASRIVVPGTRKTRYRFDYSDEMAVAERDDHIYEIVYTNGHSGVAVHSSVPYRKLGVSESSIRMHHWTESRLLEYLQFKLYEFCKNPIDGVLYGVEKGTVDVWYDESRMQVKMEAIAVARLYGPSAEGAVITPWHERLRILLDIEAEKQWSTKKAEVARIFVRELENGVSVEQAAHIAGKESGIE